MLDIRKRAMSLCGRVLCACVVTVIKRIYERPRREYLQSRKLKLAQIKEEHNPSSSIDLSLLFFGVYRHRSPSKLRLDYFFIVFYRESNNKKNIYIYTVPSVGESIRGPIAFVFIGHFVHAPAIAVLYCPASDDTAQARRTNFS